MGVDHKGQRFCDHCGRLFSKAVRVHLGAEYCRSCYQTQFRPAICVKCSGRMRAHRLASGPVCDGCQRAERVCQRCGQLTPRAARLVGGKAVCPRCAYHFNLERKCETCGRQTKRFFRSFIDVQDAAPSRAMGSLVQCQSCRNKATHATCVTCKRYRKVVAFDLGQKPMCADCAEMPPVTHICPSCGDAVAGGGYANCLVCSVRAAATKTATVLGAALEQSWTIGVWFGFADTLINSANRIRKAARVLRASLPYFVGIDDIVAEIGVPTAAELHRRIPSADHRRHLLAYRYVLGVIGDEGAATAREESTERTRLAEVLDRARAKRYETLLVAYVEQLRGGSVALKTVRLYAGVAQSFCERARVGPERPWADAAIKAFLRDTPGAANSLSRFVSFCRGHFGWEVRMPSKRERQHEQARASRDVERLRRALQKVDARPVSELKLLDVARVISAATGVPLRSLTSAREVDSLASGSVLVNEDASIEPGHRLYPYTLRWQQLIAQRCVRSVTGPLLSSPGSALNFSMKEDCDG